MFQQRENHDADTCAPRAHRYLWLAAIALSACSGIPIRGSDGTQYHVILGFGIVAVHDGCPSALVVSRAQALGISLSDRPGLRFGAGYSSSLVVSVADGAEDVRAEISALPSGALNVDAPRAQLRNAASSPSLQRGKEDACSSHSDRSE